MRRSVGVAILAILVGVALWYRYGQDEPAPLERPLAGEARMQRPEAPASELMVSEPTWSAAPAGEQPGAEPGMLLREPRPPTDAPLPPLADSDAPVRQALTEALGASIDALLAPKDLVRHLVVTLDHLDGDPVRTDFWPVRNVPEQPQVLARDTEQANPATFLWDADNAKRYRPYVMVIEAAEPATVARLYAHYYPLLQDAYTELGYPGRSFHARLLAVIDHLLATPQAPYPFVLKRAKVLYEFADPRLEALSWGQKTLIRIGPENRAVVEGKLRALRRALFNNSLE